MLDILSPSIIGGVLMIFGAFFMFKGLVYYASMMYLVADVCWILLSVRDSDVVGTIFIIIGTILGILTFLKLHYNILLKDINVQ